MSEGPHALCIGRRPRGDDCLVIGSTQWLNIHAMHVLSCWQSSHCVPVAVSQIADWLPSSDGSLNAWLPRCVEVLSRKLLLRISFVGGATSRSLR